MTKNKKEKSLARPLALSADISYTEALRMLRTAATLEAQDAAEEAPQTPQDAR